MNPSSCLSPSKLDSELARLLWGWHNYVISPNNEHSPNLSLTWHAKVKRSNGLSKSEVKPDALALYQGNKSYYGQAFSC